MVQPSTQPAETAPAPVQPSEAAPAPAMPDPAQTAPVQEGSAPAQILPVTPEAAG